MYLSPAPQYHAAPAALHDVGDRGRRHCDRDGPLRRGGRSCGSSRRYRVTAHSGRADDVRAAPQAADRRYAHGSSTCRRCTCVHPRCRTCPVPVKRFIIGWFGPVVHEYYAGTEANGFVYCNSAQWLGRSRHGRVCRSKLHSCTSVATTSKSCRPARAARCTSRVSAAFEYHNDPGKTAQLAPSATAGHARRRRLRSTTTGSCISRTAHAYLIISGGVNIYPQEAENLLVTHPQVIDVAVFGIPDDEFGEDVKAVVQPVTCRPTTRRPRHGGRADPLLPSQPGRRQVPRTVDFRASAPAPDGQALQALLAA